MSRNSRVLDKPVQRDLPYVEADLNYLIPTAEKPVNYTYDPPAGIPRLVVPFREGCREKSERA